MAQEKEDKTTVGDVLANLLAQWFESVGSDSEVVSVPRATIQAVPSQTPKYLRMRSGDLVVHSAVFILFEDEQVELTLDSLPDEMP